LAHILPNGKKSIQVPFCQAISIVIKSQERREKKTKKKT